MTKQETQYPSNSYASRDKASYDIPKKEAKRNAEEKPEKEKIAPVAKAKVRKQSLLKRITKSMIEDSVEMAREHAINDIIVPGFKSLIFDTINEMLDVMLFGGSERPVGGSQRHFNGSRNEERISYSGYYNKRSSRGSERGKRESFYEPDDIILDTRNEARDVLNTLDRVIRQYGQASVADFYDIVGVTGDWTDNQYGWTNIRDARIVPVRDGFRLDMPRTEVMD